MIAISDRRKPDTETDIAKRVGVGRRTVQTVKKDFGEAADLKAFLWRKNRETPPVPPKVTGEPEVRIIAPSGIPCLDVEIIGRHLRKITVCRLPFPYDDEPPFKKTLLKPHLKDCRCIPPQYNGAFVAAIYARPYDEACPVVCMDEKPYRLLDQEALFMFTEPLGRAGAWGSLSEEDETGLGGVNQMAA